MKFRPTTERWWTKPVGLAAAVVLLVALLPIMLLALPFLAIGAWLGRWKRHRLQRAFNARWGTSGKRLLLVYSNSPHWQAYIEEHWLPRLGGMAVVLNWSERAEWPEHHPLEARIFRMWAGDREFNPVAIVIPERGPVRVIRFWRAFRDYRQGRERALRAAEAELGSALAAVGVTSQGVRRARPEDAPAVAALSSQLGHPVPESILAQRLGRILDRTDEIVLVGCGPDGAVIGWVHGAEQRFLEADPRCELLGLVVDRGHRRQGVGERLVTAVENWARSRGVTEISVRSNIVRPESHPFYEHLGYRRAKTQHVYRKRLGGAT